MLGMYMSVSFATDDNLVSLASLASLGSYHTLIETNRLREDYPKISDVNIHAPPNLLLNDRDWEVLVNLLESDDSPEIMADVQEGLRRLSPEPDWDDYPESLLAIFDFLF
jgi:hypothetical protein